MKACVSCMLTLVRRKVSNHKISGISISGEYRHSAFFERQNCMSRRFRNYGDNASDPSHHSITKKSNLSGNQASRHPKGPRKCVVYSIIANYRPIYRRTTKYLPIIILIFAISIASSEFRTLALYPAIAYALIKGVDVIINQKRRRKK